MQQKHELEQFIEAKDKIIAGLNKQIAGKDETIVKMYNLLARNDKTIAELNKIIPELNKVIAGKDETIVKMYNLIAGNDKTIAEFFNLIAGNDKTIAARDKEIALDGEKIDGKKETIAEQNKENSEQNKEIAILSNGIAARDKEIAELNKENSELNKEIISIEERAFKQGVVVTVVMGAAGLSLLSYFSASNLPIITNNVIANNTPGLPVQIQADSEIVKLDDLQITQNSTAVQEVVSNPSWTTIAENSQGCTKSSTQNTWLGYMKSNTTDIAPSMDF